MRKSCRAGLTSHRQRSRLRQTGQLAIEAAGPDSGSDSDTSGDEDETSAAHPKPLARQQQQQQPANQQQQQQQQQVQQQPQQEQQQEQEQPAAALESLEPDGEHWLLPLDLPPLDQTLHLPEPHLPVWHDMLGVQATHDMHGLMGLQADLGAAAAEAATAGSAQPDASDALTDTMFAAMAADARAGQGQQPCGAPACPAAGGGGGGSCVDAAGFAAQMAAAAAEAAAERVWWGLQVACCINNTIQHTAPLNQQLLRFGQQHWTAAATAAALPVGNCWGLAAAAVAPAAVQSVLSTCRRCPTTAAGQREQCQHSRQEQEGQGWLCGCASGCRCHC